MALTSEQADFCKAMAPLFWWKKPEELLERPERTLAGVMDRGDVAKWREMERKFSREIIVRALETAVCGEFHNWSWRFWRLRYGLNADAPLPARMPGMPPPTGADWFKKLQRQHPPKDYNNPGERLAWLIKLREAGNADQA